MANELDETNPAHAPNPAGRDVGVIERQLPVRVGTGSLIFEIALWVLGILPGLVFLFMKINARSYLQKLQQKIQSDASQIDNFLEQRVVILQNVAALVEKAVALDREVMTSVAALRAGGFAGTGGANAAAAAGGAGVGAAPSDAARNAASLRLDTIASRLNIAFEQYPELRAHAAIADAMQQNSYLQKEITAARALYNDTVNIWNTDIFAWPTKMIVAARAGYTTRLPFSASAETKARARSQFF
ncbi:MAG: LemA family protein [Puniceicoccales bacterium]|nr:LemA family protein [Puniceicoccales bacterium]